LTVDTVLRRGNERRRVQVCIKTLLDAARSLVALKSETGRETGSGCSRNCSAIGGAASRIGHAKRQTRLKDCDAADRPMRQSRTLPSGRIREERRLILIAQDQA